MQVTLASGMVEMFLKGKEHDYVGPFSGQVSGLIKEIKPAAEVLADIVEETVEILTQKMPENITAS
jgi:hypothetical protein